MAQLRSLQTLVSNALEVVEFKLVRDRADLEDDSTIFRPTYAHQIFGEAESIFGYKDLRVRLYYTAGSLQIYLGIKYAERVDDFTRDGLRADDVHGKIAELLTAGCLYTNLDEFATRLQSAGETQFAPLGEKVDECRLAGRHFEFYKCDSRTAGFLAFHARLQTFLLWFVDAGSYIDADDPQWVFYMCYERYRDAASGEERYATVGYTTIYLYYAYPAHIRPRISQMLVLPPYQRLGIGTRLLSTVYAQYQRDERVRDITVEDPSDEFRHIRNVVDVRLLRELPAFAEQRLRGGCDAEMVAAAKELKINAKQCRVVYEILRLGVTDVGEEEAYRAYRLSIKKRLNQTYHRQRMEVRKLEKAGVDPQWLVAALPTLEERIEQLRGEYQEVEEEYRLVLEKVDGVGSGE